MIAREFGCSPDDVRDKWSSEAFFDAERLIAAESHGKQKAKERAERSAKSKR